MPDANDSNADVRRMTPYEAAAHQSLKNMEGWLAKIERTIECNRAERIEQHREMTAKLDALTSRCGRDCGAMTGLRAVGSRVRQNEDQLRDIETATKSSKQTWGLMGALFMAAASIIFSIWNALKK